MLVFPQLSTGCVAQAPIIRQDVVRRVARSRLDGVYEASLRDTKADSIEWDLIFQSLSDEERGRIETLFIDAQGSLRSFTFLDPADNLLRWSEDFSNPAWLKEAGLMTTPGLQDAFGGLTATGIANSTAATRSVSQTIAAPASFSYCFSFYIRAGAPSSIGLKLASVDASYAAQVIAANAWKRVDLTSKLSSLADDVTVSIEVGANTAVDICGAQLEAQVAPSGYKRTMERSGVYSNTRFRHDKLKLRADGVNEHSTQLHLMSRL